MSSREIYPNAPLVSVSFELRHPESSPFTQNQRSLFKEMVRQYLPIMKTQQSTTQTFEIGPSGPIQQLNTEEFPKYLNRDSTLAASILKNSIVVETTQYPGWDHFREIIIAVCLARNEASRIDGVERIGMRYIDEIRIHDDVRPDWGNYLSDSLLGPSIAGELDLPLAQSQGLAAYGPAEGRSLVLRYGSSEGFATDPNGELRRKTPPYPGPFFLLDIDSFWVPESGVPEFSDTLLMEYAEHLHTPIRRTFEELITDRLRNEVLR
ncbi:TIGR04255 family protein [Arthrobacter sp. Z1-15]